MKKNSAVPPAPETNLDRLSAKMKEIVVRAKYPTNDDELQNAPTAMGNLTDCKFYISDDENARLSGMAFRVAYKVATQPQINSKELCAAVGSMLCEVYSGFRSSVEEALKGIGVRPVLVRLPSQAREHNIVESQSQLPQMDWPQILVNFGCCVRSLFEKPHSPFMFISLRETFMSTCVDELKKRVGCVLDPNVPLTESDKSFHIRNMLGASSSLRKTAISFLVAGAKRGDAGMVSVCEYLCGILSWFGMGDFTLLNDMLVRPRSPVLLDHRVSREVHNLTEACEAVAACPYPQFFMHLANNLELVKLEPWRFPTLIAVARELESGHKSAKSIPGVNQNTVEALVKLHGTAMGQQAMALAAKP